MWLNMQFDHGKRIDSFLHSQLKKKKERAQGAWNTTTHALNKRTDKIDGLHYNWWHPTAMTVEQDIKWRKKEKKGKIHHISIQCKKKKKLSNSRLTQTNQTP